MKIATIVGARPQFIKAAVVTRAIEERRLSGVDLTEFYVHTGQHYSPGMSDVFFANLSLPQPKYHLGIGSGSHGQQTGRMLEAIESTLHHERPDVVLIYGDTNSTLAGALAAVKLHLPLAHVEAGLRSFNRRMPEEINRIVADQVSDLLFVPTETAIRNLAAEGITRGVHLVGDVMYDAALHYSARAKPVEPPLTPGGFLVATIHRAENTDDAPRLARILEILAQLSLDADRPVILPLHPRTKQCLDREKIRVAAGIRVTEPVDYFEMLGLIRDSAVVLTDSGGVQKEAFFLGKPCITLRHETEWIETVELGWNIVVGDDREAARAALHRFLTQPLPTIPRQPFGDGSAGKKIVDLLLRELVGSRTQELLGDARGRND